MKVTIVGAGFSGLTLGYFLARRGAQVEILEKSSRAGGMIATRRSEFGFAEAAANGILNTALAEELFADIGVPLAPRLPFRKNRYVFRGRPRRWPLAFFETIRFASGFLLRFLFRRLRPDDKETMAMWARRTGGSAFEKYLMSPALQGIYAGDSTRLSASLILGRFFSRRKTVRPREPGTVAPALGMEQLTERLTSWLLDRGVEIRFDAAETPPGGQVLVIATSAWDASWYLRERAPEVAALLAQVESVAVMSVTLHFSETEDRCRGFGCLFPSEEKFNSLGVVFMSDVFADRGSGRTETWILGGALHGELLSLTDAQVEARVLEDRLRLFGAVRRPQAIRITRWPKGLPHYTRELAVLLRGLRLPNGVFLTGNYLGHIGLSNILEYNRELAEKIYA